MNKSYLLSTCLGLCLIANVGYTIMIEDQLMHHRNEISAKINECEKELPRNVDCDYEIKAFVVK